MTNTTQSGQLDPNFGDGGFATLPLPKPIPDLFPDFRNAYSERDGSTVYYSLDHHNEPPPEQSGFYLSRLSADGKSHTHAPVIHVNEHLPGCYDLSIQQGAYSQGAAPLGFSMGHHYWDDDRTRTYIVIARFTQNLTPHPGFGDNGFAKPKPDPVVEGPVTRDLSDPQPEDPSLTGLLNTDLPRGAVVGERIRAVFRSRLVEYERTIQATTVLASFAASDGSPVADLGKDKNAYAVKIPDQDGEPLTPYDAHFYPDGSFLLLGGTSRNMYLQRFHENGLKDDTFAGGSPIILQRRARYRLAVSSKRIVVVSAAPLLPSGSATLVWAYTPEGQVDARFNQGRQLALRIDGDSSLMLDHVAIDSEDRLVLTGTRWNREKSLWHVTRVLENGSLDDSFADGGHFQGPEAMTAGTDLFLQGNDIRIACAKSSSEEQIAKLAP